LARLVSQLNDSTIQSVIRQSKRGNTGRLLDCKTWKKANE